ncbi:hypothetical protein [Eremococcus coleocola]|uniref:Uncharacterized protein n=1 Tax=Eremococcus coleocola ACS-139-V-Col8 TaxID=908337 RepID=E4KPT1_9LACT|nr:hypothetical protein [Eremococcus coleocola]EFR31164.1 hypothetical protein HMPREF9257_1570 [Eremococcus coleocola ACS-139-V-Col8]
MAIAIGKEDMEKRGEAIRSSATLFPMFFLSCSPSYLYAASGL